MSDEHFQLHAFLASNQKTKRGAFIFIKGTCQLNQETQSPYNKCRGSHLCTFAHVLMQKYTISLCTYQHTSTYITSSTFDRFCCNSCSQCFRLCTDLAVYTLHFALNYVSTITFYNCTIMLLSKYLHYIFTLVMLKLVKTLLKILILNISRF